MRALLLDVCGRNNLSREVEPLAQVVETLGGEGVVVVLPGELGLHIAPGVQGLAGLDDLLILKRLVRGISGFTCAIKKAKVRQVLHRGSWCQCRDAWEG